MSLKFRLLSFLSRNTLSRFETEIYKLAQPYIAQAKLRHYDSG